MPKRARAKSKPKLLKLKIKKGRPVKKPAGSYSVPFTVDIRGERARVQGFGDHGS